MNLQFQNRKLKENRVAFRNVASCGHKKQSPIGICFIALFLTAAMLFSMLPGNIGMEKVYAAPRRTVKVGFFPMSGYNEKAEDGSYSGMDVEYLDALNDYNNWDIEYVECDSWDEALQKLAAKEIDLVGSAQYSKERAEKYQYADLASGYTFGAIAVKADSTLAYEDFDAMRDITYGIVKTYIRKEEFYEYLSENGVNNPRVREYENTAQLQEALQNGDVDAFVHSLTEVEEGRRVVGRFSPMPFYYISYQGNGEVMRELNKGITDLKMNRPELENELMVKYYDSRLDQSILLTGDEKQYIEKKKNLTVGYLDGYYPFSYENDGQYQGLSKQVLEQVSVSTGLTFTYVKLKDMNEAKQFLANGSIDVLSYCPETPASMKEGGAALTKVYAKVPNVVIMKKSDQAKRISRLAFMEKSASEESRSGFADEDMQLLAFSSQLECLEAVRSGEADAALCDGYLAEYLLGSGFRFNNMEIHSVLSEVHPIYMAVKGEENSLLLDIFNKELLTVSDKMVNDYMLQDNFYSKISIENFIKNNSILIILILSFVAIIIILVMLHMLRNSRRIQRLMYKDAEFDIWNFNYLKYKATQKLSEDKNAKYAIVYTDIFQFKRYNTLYGWHAGQKILELFIEVITKELDKEGELCARNNGVHFVLFVKYESAAELERRLSDIEEKIANRIYEEVQIHMAVGMGVFCMPQGENDVMLALAYGIQANDLLKNSYSNAIQIYDEKMKEQLKEHHDREKLLESVDVWKDFVVYYQAKVDIRNEEVVGAEALVRFMDPTQNGAIKSPGFFVPYYEQTGRITEIDFFVMESVCVMLRKRIDEGKKVVPVSCNFSRLHFVKEGFPEKFDEIINKYQVPKELIEVEITETLVVEELQQQRVKETVELLKQNGVRLSIDDFGTGYSSLGVFEQIPASVIKLDRAFLINNENRGRQVKIMKNIVNLAKDLEAQIVCEGVETEQDTELMMEIGAYVAQGYRYCKPVPVEEFERLLES